VILNRAIEAARRAHLAPLFSRALSVEKTPLLVIPGMFGSRLIDARGAVVWGSTARLYFGPSIPEADARADRVLDAITIVPALAGYDCHGGLFRFLCAAGYRLGATLIPFAYDWRAGVEEAARALGSAVDRVARDRVDLLAISTGGQVARRFLVEHAPRVRRVVYLGAPQRGTFDALVSLHRGFRFAPAGKKFDGADAARCQTSLDALPHPDEPLFVDETSERDVRCDLYDPYTWRALGLARWPLDGGFAERLSRARDLHRALDGAPAHDAFVIGARHLPTPARALLVDGRARLPPPRPRKNDRRAALVYRAGDGELPESSLRALPGLDEKRLQWVTPSRHNRLPSDLASQRLVLEALLAS